MLEGGVPIQCYTAERPEAGRAGTGSLPEEGMQAEGRLSAG